jgi:hypothetical protein
MTMTGAESLNVAALVAAQGTQGQANAMPNVQTNAQPDAQTMQFGWGTSLTDLGAFDQALQKAALRIDAPLSSPSPAAKAVMRAFDSINGEAVQLAKDAQAAQAGNRELSPGELVSLTVRCQEFMFHCQLTSNIANRTSDGLQQLFRQQS